MMNAPPKVAVLMGGIGRERDVSLQSGACVLEALTGAGVEALAWDTTPDTLQILDDNTIDCFFIALHGEFGEDGGIQTILEHKGRVYTGSRPDVCQHTFHKMATKASLAEVGLLTPRAVAFAPGQTNEQLCINDKVVIKPICQGSSVGIHIVDSTHDVAVLCEQVFAEFGDCMVEEFIKGRELTVGMLNGRALPVIEIRPQADFYDYHAKYVDESTQYLFDTVEPSLACTLQRDALSCCQHLGLRHMARVDYILGPDDRAYVLEVNTIPGLTSHSLLPKAGARVGLSLGDLCREVVNAACRP
jgi:D-alanine-D-alanine ligase